MLTYAGMFTWDLGFTSERLCNCPLEGEGTHTRRAESASSPPQHPYCLAGRGYFRCVRKKATFSGWRRCGRGASRFFEITACDDIGVCFVYRGILRTRFSQSWSAVHSAFILLVLISLEREGSSSCFRFSKSKSFTKRRWCTTPFFVYTANQAAWVVYLECWTWLTFFLCTDWVKSLMNLDLRYEFGHFNVLFASMPQSTGRQG